MRKLRQVIVVSDLLDVKQSSEIIRAIRIGSSQPGKKNLSKNLFQAVSLSQTESRKWRDFYGARQKQMLFLRIKSPFFVFVILILKEHLKDLTVHPIVFIISKDAQCRANIYFCQKEIVMDCVPKLCS